MAGGLQRGKAMAAWADSEYTDTACASYLREQLNPPVLSTVL